MPKTVLVGFKPVLTEESASSSDGGGLVMSQGTWKFWVTCHDAVWELRESLLGSILGMCVFLRKPGVEMFRGVEWPTGKSGTL